MLSYKRLIFRNEGVQIYIGDGATITRTFIRKRGRALIGHSPVRKQLTWCQKEGVPRAIITHCGSEIVTGDEREISARIRATAIERGIEVRIAYDGMKVRIGVKSDARTPAQGGQAVRSSKASRNLHAPFDRFRTKCFGVR